MKRLLAATFLNALLLTACRGQSMTNAQQHQKLDQTFQKIVESLRTSPSVKLRLCGPLPGERDYRYRYCFTELTGSAGNTMQEIRNTITASGWSMTSSGGDPSELDTSYILSGTPYQLNAKFEGGPISLTVLQSDVGFVKPLDDHAVTPYAVLQPEVFAHVQGLRFLEASTTTQNSQMNSQRVRACGLTTPSEASACIDGPLSREAVSRAFSRMYFAGDIQEYDRLNKSERFQSSNEKTMAELVAEGLAQPGEISSTLFEKQSQFKYLAIDKRDFPAYTVKYTLEYQGDMILARVNVIKN